VASQGHYDEEALAPALRAGVSYVGLVASRTRGSAVTALLEGSGVPAVARLRVPAGLDLGARAAPEVAVSILAEIVQARSTRTGVTSALDMGRSTPVPGETAIDPVCGMQVDVSAARHQAEVDGVLYYFCGAGCRARFVQTPTEYLSRSS